MKREEFKRKLDQLTSSQKPVLKSFLEGKTDLEIVSVIGCNDRSSVSKHISNVCKIFDLSNGEGEHFSYRDELIEIFCTFQHEDYKVAPQLCREFRLLKSKPEFPGRPVALDSPFYILDSSILKECSDEIVNYDYDYDYDENKIINTSSLVRIKAPRKMGKTSLLRRILAIGTKQGYKTVYIDLRKEADQNHLEDSYRFLRWFCALVSYKLEITSHFEEWDDKGKIGNKECCSIYFENLLEQLENPLVLAIDEIDLLFSYPDTAEVFFTLLRAWYEEPNNLEAFGKLKQVISYSTDLYIKFDINQSPFNVGHPVALPKLTADQVQQLAQRYDLTSVQEENVKSLMQLVGGQPYLIQLALYHLYQGKMTLETLLKAATTFDGIYHNHLQHLWNSLQECETPTIGNQLTASEALRQIITSPGGVKLEPEISFKLHRLGLVDPVDNQVKISCKLYRNYFRERLG